jgi:hypothetical protein
VFFLGNNGSREIEGKRDRERREKMTDRMVEWVDR